MNTKLMGARGGGEGHGVLWVRWSGGSYWSERLT